MRRRPGACRFGQITSQRSRRLSCGDLAQKPPREVGRGRGEKIRDGCAVLFFSDDHVNKILDVTPYIQDIFHDMQRASGTLKPLASFA